MALIICPECGRQISDLAEYCVGCGFPIDSIKIIDQHISDRKKDIIENIHGTGERKIRCIICSSEYDYSEHLCSKCGYPAMHLSDKPDILEAVIKSCKKKVWAADLKNINDFLVDLIKLDDSIEAESLIGRSFYFGNFGENEISWVCIDANEDELMLLSETFLGTGDYSNAVQFCKTFSQKYLSKEEESVLTDKKSFLLSQRDFANYKNIITAADLDNGDNIGWWIKRGGETGSIVSKDGEITDSIPKSKSKYTFRPACSISISRAIEAIRYKKDINRMNVFLRDYPEKEITGLLEIMRKSDKTYGELVDFLKGEVFPGEKIVIGQYNREDLTWTEVKRNKSERLYLCDLALGMMTLSQIEKALVNHLSGLVSFSNKEYNVFIDPKKSTIRLLKPSEANEIAKRNPEIKQGTILNYRKDNDLRAWWLQNEDDSSQRNPVMSSRGEILLNSYERTSRLAFRPLIVLRTSLED